MVYHNKNIIMPPVSIVTCKPPEQLTLVLHQGRVGLRFVAHINVVIVSRTSPFPMVPRAHAVYMPIWRKAAKTCHANWDSADHFPSQRYRT